MSYARFMIGQLKCLLEADWLIEIFAVYRFGRTISIGNIFITKATTKR